MQNTRITVGPNSISVDCGFRRKFKPDEESACDPQIFRERQGEEERRENPPVSFIDDKDQITKHEDEAKAKVNPETAQQLKDASPEYSSGVYQVSWRSGYNIYKDKNQVFRYAYGSSYESDTRLRDTFDIVLDGAHFGVTLASIAMGVMCASMLSF